MHCSRCFDKSLVLRDGIRLLSRIWLPNSNGPWPALLMRQPYGREIASTITYSHPEWWASKGYMVIIQDVRGMGGLMEFLVVSNKKLAILLKHTNG